MGLLLTAGTIEGAKVSVHMPTHPCTHMVNNILLKKKKFLKRGFGASCV